MSEPRYNIATWDMDLQAYTPQQGLSVPSQNVDWKGLLAVVRELRTMGYSCHYCRDADGSHDDNDFYVLIERADGHPERWEKRIDVEVEI